jgi:pimeloyl-ACP methyl ester carboxylesterase
MASPHAVGVAALIVSQYGKADRKHGGLTLDPSVTERILQSSAVEHACPSPRTFTWHRIRLDGTTADAEAAWREPVRAPRLLVGLSLGGYLGIEYAATHPGRIDGLVAASCGTRPRGAGLAGYRRLADAIGRLPDRGRALNDLMVRVFLPRESVDDVLAGGVALDVMAPALGAVGALDPEDALARIDVPVWLVNGRFDHFRIEERRMLRATRHGRLVVVPGATHLVSLARPEDFTAAVLGAVAELERRASVARRRTATAG